MLSISGIINYDGLTKLLTARCASLEANIATLYLGMCVANNRMTIKHVKKSGLYGKYIRGEMVEKYIIPELYPLEPYGPYLCHKHLTNLTIKIVYS